MAIVPVCVVGCAVKMVELWVWSTDPDFHPTVYCFKAMAVVTGLKRVCIVCLLFANLPAPLLVPQCLELSVYGCHSAGAHLVLLVTAVRFVRTFCSRRRQKHLLSLSVIRFAVSFILVMSMATEFLLKMTVTWCDRAHYMSINMHTWISTILLSVLLQLLLAVATLCKVNWPLYLLLKDNNQQRWAVFRVYQSVHSTELCVLYLCVHNLLVYPGIAVILKHRLTHKDYPVWEASMVLAPLVLDTCNTVVYYFLLQYFRKQCHQRRAELRQHQCCAGRNTNVMSPHVVHSADSTRALFDYKSSRDRLFRRMAGLRYCGDCLGCGDSPVNIASDRHSPARSVHVDGYWSNCDTYSSVRIHRGYDHPAQTTRGFSSAPPFYQPPHVRDMNRREGFRRSTSFHNRASVHRSVSALSRRSF
jgi:hypothetical protein